MNRRAAVLFFLFCPVITNALVSLSRSYSLHSPVVPFSDKKFIRPRDHYNLPRLHKSIKNDDDDLSDELSKLIGKRASIGKHNSLDDSVSNTSNDVTNKRKKDTIASMYEGKTGMDMFEMPEFQSKRPLRISEINDPSRAPGGSKNGDEEKESLYIDFMAEYEDENEFHIPNRIGFGTKDWGDSTAGFRFGKKLKKKELKRGMFLAGDLQVAYNKLIDAGIVYVDTSETYGYENRKNNLSSEQILGKVQTANVDSSSLIATTMSNPWKSLLRLYGGGIKGSLRYGRRGILKSIKASAGRLGVSAIDSYQVPHHMLYIGFPNVVTDALIMAMDEGLVNNVGVCNFDKNSMKRFARKLSGKGYQLVSNQFEFSLINRKAYKSGLIQTCKRLGVIPLAHTPLGRGLASGIYTNTNPTGGQASGVQPFDFKTLDKYDVLHGMLATVASKVKKRLTKENQELMNRRSRYNEPINTDVSTSQIAINYVVAKGCVPIVGIKNPKEADELIACLGWGLTSDEVKMLDDAADMCN